MEYINRLYLYKCLFKISANNNSNECSSKQYRFSQSTLFLWELNQYAGDTQIAFQITEKIIINLLTSLWAIHLVLKIVKNSRSHKLEASLTSGSEFKKLEEAYRILRNKNCILLALCSCELTFAMSTILLTLFGNYISSPELHEYPRHFWGFPIFDHLSANKHLLFKVMNSALLTSFISMIILIRILTQYMYICYSYFKQAIRLKYLIAYLCLSSGIIFIFGICHSYSIFVQSILYQIILMVEFVLYVRYTIKLVHCLYKRYFDSRHHEYQSHWVINYYKRAYISFKLRMFYFPHNRTLLPYCNAFNCLNYTTSVFPY